MTALLSAVFPIVLCALFAGQVAVTRTGQLRKDILANLDLLDRLPAEHPSRAELEAKNGELLGVLARRQQRRYGPFTQAGTWFRALVGLTGAALTFAGFSALFAAGILPSRAASEPPPTSQNYWFSVGFFLVMAAGFAVFAVWSARRQLREHPPPVQQPTEAAKAGTGSA